MLSCCIIGGHFGDVVVLGRTWLQGNGNLEKSDRKTSSYKKLASHCVSGLCPQAANSRLKCIMYLKSFILAAALTGQAFATKRYKYVATFSVDGLHGSDVEKYVAVRLQSTIAEMLENAYEYKNVYTSAPSDSYPSTLNQFTGAHPRTTGVWYDDTYDRTYYPPFSTTGTNCAGPAGAEGLQYFLFLLT